MHHIPDTTDLSGYIVDKFFRRDARFLGLQFDLLSMLIRSCLKEHIETLLPFESGDTVRQNRLICISDVRLS